MDPDDLYLLIGIIAAGAILWGWWEDWQGHRAAKRRREEQT